MAPGICNGDVPHPYYFIHLTRRSPDVAGPFASFPPRNARVFVFFRCSQGNSWASFRSSGTVGQSRQDDRWQREFRDGERTLGGALQMVNNPRVQTPAQEQSDACIFCAHSFYCR